MTLDILLIAIVVCSLLGAAVCAVEIHGRYTEMHQPVDAQPVTYFDEESAESEDQAGNSDRHHVRTPAI